MRGRFFLDTNLFVYSFDHTSPAKATRAKQLIGHALTSGRGIVSYQVVQEFLNVALRRFAKPMSIADAQQYLASVFRRLLSVHSSQTLYAEALELAGRYQFAWYDSLIVAAAIAGRCSTLYSEDLQHGMQIGDMRVEKSLPLKLFEDRAETRHDLCADRRARLFRREPVMLPHVPRLPKMPALVRDQK